MSKWKCEICGAEFENFHAQGFDNKIYCPLCYFKRENQELKKQLSNDHQIKIKRLQQENRKLKQQLSNSHQIKNQQKEFIEWLEDYIDALKQQKETIEGLDIGEEHILMILEEVLEKYKGIIGGSNENNSI